MTRTLYVVRHCRADGQSADSPLTDEGRAQAIALAEFLTVRGIERIVSSPFTRARQSIVPLAQRLGIVVETDDRLVERALGGAEPRWIDRLQATFEDLDLCFDGGESSRVAMARGVAVIYDVLKTRAAATVVVTHGNLMTLLLKHFDDRYGFEHWRGLSNPDVFRIDVGRTATAVNRVWQPLG